MKALASESDYQLYCADSIVISGDRVIDHIGVAVCVYDRDNGDTKLMAFEDCDRFTARVDDEECIRNILHFFDAGKVLLKFFFPCEAVLSLFWGTC